MGNKTVVTLALVALLQAQSTSSGSVAILPGGLGQLSVPVTSLNEIKFQGVIKQAYDFSCGSAAVATLLSFYYDRPTVERDVFLAMYEFGNQEKIRRKGFSMLDMKLYLENNGYRADGFRIGLDKLIEVDVPAIALINTRGYSHFVVVKASDAERVLLSDPAAGNRVVRRTQFEQIWNGIFLLVHSHVEVAKPHFNQADAWANHPPAPLGKALSRQTLAQFTLSLSPRLGDY